MSALETEDDDEASEKEKELTSQPAQQAHSRRASATDAKSRRPSMPEGLGVLGGLSAALSMSTIQSDGTEGASSATCPDSHGGHHTTMSSVSKPHASKAIPEDIRIHIPAQDNVHAPQSQSQAQTLGGSSFQHPSDLAAQLYANPKLAALRGPMPLSMTPIQPVRDKASISPPILANTKCSGYFVEPVSSLFVSFESVCTDRNVDMDAGEQMKWMEFFLEEGRLAGKILCPNKKCVAKLGNYDWAGQCCSCKEWVVPVRTPFQVLLIVKC